MLDTCAPVNPFAPDPAYADRLWVDAVRGRFHRAGFVLGPPVTLTRRTLGLNIFTATS